jgi:hypothetical protein
MIPMLNPSPFTSGGIPRCQLGDDAHEHTLSLVNTTITPQRKNILYTCFQSANYHYLRYPENNIIPLVTDLGI